MRVIKRMLDMCRNHKTVFSRELAGEKVDSEEAQKEREKEWKDSDDYLLHTSK